MTIDAQVLVVGTGPTGLTLACCLARHGVDVRVIEQRANAPSMERGARGTAYQPRSLEVFDDLGVIDEILADTWTDMPLRTYKGAELAADASTLAAMPTPEVPYPTMARPLQSWRVEEILWNRLAALGVKVEASRRLVHLEQDAEGVTAWIEEAEPGTEGWGHALAPHRVDGGDDLAKAERIRVEYLVGCDGGRSTVRGLAGIAYESRRGPDEFDFVGMVADVCVEGLEPTYFRAWFTADGKEVALSPQPTTKNYQFIAQLEPDEGDAYPEPSLELAQRIVDERCPVPGVRLHDMTWKGLFKVRESLADHFRAGRVFVAGDAAHLHSGMGGQGANGGLQDAYNLGWKLAYVVAGDGREVLLDSYEDERRKVAEATLKWTGDEHLAVHAPEGERRRLGVDDDFLAKMSQLFIAYPDSPLNSGTGAAQRPTLGDRAPDGRIIARETGQRLRLFDLYRGDHFTLLLFGADLAEVGRTVGDRFGRLVRPALLKDVDDDVKDWGGATFVDPHGRVAAVYQAMDRPLVLVRPDGHIAFHGSASETDTLLAQLHRLLVPAGGALESSKRR